MMRNIPTVFTTSGFVLPLTAYHTPYREINGVNETIFTKMFASNSDQILREYFKSSDIYISDTAKKLFDAYMTEQSFDNFIAIVDMVADTLGVCTPAQFFQWQIGSKHITNMSLMFCTDVVSGKFLKNYNTYNVLGFNSRFAISNSMTATQAGACWREMDKLLKNCGMSESWTGILTPMMGNRSAFITFFKHIFVDFY